MPKTAAVTERKRIEIHRNDTVKVIAGKDKGKQGRVLRVFPGDNKLLVEHVMMVRKHVKANPPRVKGGNTPAKTVEFPPSFDRDRAPLSLNFSRRPM
jgi:ribosomal protein L24